MQAVRRALLAAAAGLALADAAIVTLALPALLVELDTTVEGVAAVIAVYTAVLALAPVPLERLARRTGHRTVAVGGFALFAAASLACAAAGSLPVLLAARAAQALGGAGALVAAFGLLRGGTREGRRWWVAAAVIATAIGPALGGVLTEALDWRAIFVAQAPIAAAAALVALRAPRPEAEPATRWRREHVRPAIGLALLSAALTAVLFLLVLLLVAGFAADPLAAAGVVTVTPVAAVLGALIPGDARVRAAAGALLVGGGTLALADLPGDRLAWTVPAQLLAGAGLGLALPAIAGPLLPERTAGDAARLLAVRHLGIAAALAVLAPLAAADLDRAQERAQLRGVALVLDAPLAPLQKLALAPSLLDGVEAERPREGLREATSRTRAGLEGEERATFDRIARRADEVLVRAVGEAFERAFVLTGVLALLAALALVPLRAPRRALAAAGAAVVAAAAAPVVYARAEERLAPRPVLLADPCRERPLPDTGGLGGFLQDAALEELDRAACRAGSTREELALALFDPSYARRFEERYGVDPQSITGLLGLLGG